MAAVDSRGREVLVTGAAGFVGAHIAEACHRNGWNVTGLDLRVPPTAGRPDHRWLTASAGSRCVLRDVAAGRYWAVVHQAAISDTTAKDSALLTEVNVTQPLALAEACVTGGASFIYASSGSVYGKAYERAPLEETSVHDRSVCSGPVNPYARSKLALDTAMERRTGGDLHWLGLRYTNVFGRGEDHKGPMASILSQMLRRAADGRPLVLFDDTLHACRDFVPVDAVVETVLSLLTDEPVTPGVYNLGSGVPISFATIVRWCASLTGAELEVVLEPNPVSSAYQYWTCADMSKLRAGLPGRPVLTVADVRSAAGQLFEGFRARPRHAIPKSGSSPVAAEPCSL